MKSDTTEVLIDRELVLYKRERSSVWQCRYKVGGVWQRTSTKQRDFEAAKKAANEIRIETEIRLRSNLPVVTRKFRDIAKLALLRIENDKKSGNAKVSTNDYKRVIENFLIPCLGKRLITNIDYSALDELDAFRIKKLGKVPTQSTMLTHNAALNRVFDEAVTRGFLTLANRPKLDATGRKSERRPAFSITEMAALLNNFDDWIERGRTKKTRELRSLLKDYVDVLLDTGARPGVELMNLKWKQIVETSEPEYVGTGEIDEEDGEEIFIIKPNRCVEMRVDGKTDERTIIGNQRTINALVRLAKRNYDAETSVQAKLIQVATPTNDDYVFRTRDKKEPTSFQKMFENYLQEHNLLIDPITEQKRVFYSLRHTYATNQLTYDATPIHTLAEQMGTSVEMIERHYSHLKVTQAKKQLRGENTAKLITASKTVEDIYKSNKVKAPSQ